MGALRRVHRLAAQGLVRRRGHARRTTTASSTCRRSPATTRTTRRCCARSTARCDGLFVMGQNPAVGSENAGLQRRALSHLKWLVVRELAETETASFWKDSPEVRSGELRTEDIGTEVFLMPAATHIEKEGCFTNTERLVQWRDKALDPPGDCRSELWFMHHLFKRVRGALRGLDGQARLADPEPHLGLLRARPPRRAERRRRAARDQRLRPDDRRAGAGLRRAQGRRHDGVRLLDLLRASTPTASTRRAGASPATCRSPAAGWRPSGAGPGPPTAACSTRAPAPTPTGARGPSASATSGGTARKWTGYDVPDFPVDKPPDYVAPGRRRGHGRDLRRATRSSCRPTAAAGCSRPPGCSTARCRRTTSRSSRR